MKRLVFIALLILLNSGPIYARWEALEKQYQPPGLETLYFDPKTIHHMGTHATLWQLTDLKWNSTTRFLSFKTHKEFDCEQSRVRVLQVIEFSRHMGIGRSAAGYIENGNWQRADESSVNHTLWKVACGKR